MSYVGAMTEQKRYEYRKMFQVSGEKDTPKVTLNIPVDLVRDFWKLEPDDKVLVTVDKNLVYRVRPMPKD